MEESKPKGILDQLDDLEAKRKAKPKAVKKEKESKDDLDLDGVW